jgi:hypothetical protein
MAQTAVEWFQEQIIKIVNGTCELSEIQIFEQAKQMEKEQIAQAWDDGNYNYFYNKKNGVDFEDGTQYYNEVYSVLNQKTDQDYNTEGRV